MPQTIVIRYDDQFNVTDLDFDSIEDIKEQSNIVSYALAFFKSPISKYKRERVHTSTEANTITINLKDNKIQSIYGDSRIWNNFLVLTKLDLSLSRQL